MHIRWSLWPVINAPANNQLRHCPSDSLIFIQLLVQSTTYIQSIRQICFEYWPRRVRIFCFKNRYLFKLIFAFIIWSLLTIMCFHKVTDIVIFSTCKNKCVCCHTSFVWLSIFVSTCQSDKIESNSNRRIVAASDWSSYNSIDYAFSPFLQTIRQRLLS